MKKYLSILLVSSIILAGCLKSDDLKLNNVKIGDWKPDWAVPLLNTTLSLDKLVKPSDYISIDGTGLYSLRYQGKLFTATASDYIKIPDQNYTTPPYTLTTPVSFPSFTGAISDSFSGSYTYADTNGSRLEHLAMKAGAINIQFTSTFNQNVSLTVVFPNIKKNGLPLQLNANIAYPVTTTTAAFDLAGYTIDLTNGGTTQNYIDYKIRYTITGTGQPIATSNTLAASVGFSNIAFSFIDGYLGRYTIPIPHDTIEVNIFNNTLQANVFLEDPKINLLFSNSFGLGVQAGLDSLYGITTTGARLRTVIPPISVSGATTPGQTALSNYVINKTNSTIQNIFNPAPNLIVYNGRVINNSSATTGYAFLMDTSTIKLSADAELPAFFKIINFVLQDTTALLLPNDTDILQRAEFKMLVLNSFPIYGNMQVYFADTNYNILDSLVQTGGGVIGEAPVDASGRVNGTTTATSMFVLSHERYSRMAPRVRFVFTRGNLKSSGSNSIKITNTDKMQVKLGLRFTLKVATTDL